MFSVPPIILTVRNTYLASIFFIVAESVQNGAHVINKLAFIFYRELKTLRKNGTPCIMQNNFNTQIA